MEYVYVDWVLKRDNELARELTAEGATQERISKALGLTTRQSARIYLLATGQHNQWRVARKKAMPELEVRIQRAGVDIFKAEEESLTWEENMAVQYLQSVARGSHPFISYVKLFSNYRNATEEGRQENLEELAEGTEFSKVTVSRILRNRELSLPQRDAQKFEVNQAIYRGAMYGFSLRDIAHYLEMNERVVHKRIKQMKQNGTIHKDARIGCNAGRNTSVRKLGVIYRMEDKGWKPVTIARKAGISLELYEKISSNRPQEESRIIHGIRFMFARPHWNVPYKTHELRLGN